MRLVSWNVNGLRAALRKGFLDWLQGSDAEIVGIQETRVLDEQLTKAAREPEGWHFHLHAAERPGYSGVGLYSRSAPDAVETSMGEDRFDIEGRIQIARFGQLLLVNGYFPNGNGKNRDLSRIPYKLDFYRGLFDLLEPARERDMPILVMGDWNTCHRPEDLARPKQNEKTSGFRPEEREELDRWMREGWVDTFRHFHPQATGRYSWWSQRGNVRERNIGWRLDFFLASEAALPYLRGAAIHDQVLGSDHCPVSVTVDRELLTSS
ncbi:MAG: exodeoxyribonuclease III [Acidobacteriota bacterium]